MLLYARTSWRFVLLISLALLICGCGGGSGGTASNNDSLSATAATAFNNTPTPVVAPSVPAAPGSNPASAPVAVTPALPVTPVPPTPPAPPATPVPPAPPVPPTPPVPPAPVPPTPVATDTTVIFQFVLARAVPTAVTTLEFRGFDSSGSVVFGPEVRARTGTVTLENVPLTVTSFRFQLAEAGVVVGQGTVPVSLTAGVDTVITDPGFSDTVRPTDVTVTPAADSLFIGQSRQLVAVQNFTDSSSSDISASASWNSSNPSAATVNSDGLVTAQSEGITTITATGQGSAGSSIITVSDPTVVVGLNVTPGTISVVVGTSQQLTARATLADSSTRLVSNDSDTSYTSLSTSVATVSGTGLINGIGPGQTQIEVTHGGQSVRVDVTVRAATLQTMALSLGQNTLEVGQSTTSSVQGNYDNGSSSDVTSSAVISSSNTGVATISGSSIQAVGTGSTVITASIGSVTATANLQVVAAPGSPGLVRLNSIRSLGGLPAVTENPTYSAEAALHSRYMVKNDFIGHSEDPANPFYTPGGDRAARNSNLSITSNLNAQLVDGIDRLMKAPFHGVGFIDPQLTESGFGFYCENIGTFRCATTVDVLRGRGPVPSGTRFPITWPADGQIMPFSSYTGGEFPDPITGLPAGFATPTGAPIYIQLGPGNATINVTNVTLTNDTTASAVSIGYFDETSYTNPTASTQSLGRAVLGSRDCLIIMASSPLTPGHRYTCRVTNAGVTTSWSFTVANVIRRQITQPSVYITR